MFNDPIAEQRFAQLVDTFGIQCLVETGTNTGFGSLAAAKYCPVVTIEVNPEFRRQALAAFRSAGGIRHPIVSLEGNSAEALSRIFLQGRCGFYLDAHWESYWPLRDELKAIAAMNKPDSVIIIHDCKVPGQPWGFDSYHGQDLDLAYVKPELDLINPAFQLAYNERASGNCRGILYATPPLHT